MLHSLLGDTLQGNRLTEIGLLLSRTVAVIAPILWLLDQSSIFVLIRQMKTLRHYIAQMLGMGACVAFFIKLSRCRCHDKRILTD